MPPSHPLGALLKQWRARLGYSQLALALQTGVSQRHISFIEKGRSSPSRTMLLTLADALDVPLRERNSLLMAAGLAPEFSDAPWNADEQRIVHRAIERILRQHDPFPALVLDRAWNVLQVNDSAPRFFGCFADLSLFPVPRNLLRLLLDPRGLKPAIYDWPALATALAARVRLEAVGGLVDAATAPLLKELTALGGPSEDSQRLPVVPVSFREGPRVLRYFSMVTSVGAPRSVSSQELRVESMFPADDETEAWHLETFAAR